MIFLFTLNKVIHGETKLTSNFQFDYEREREREIIWCTVMWKIGWLILTFHCVGEGHKKLKSKVVMRN